MTKEDAVGISIHEYEKALSSLEEAILYVGSAESPAKMKLFRDGAIQRFEFCVELAWKASIKALGSTATAPKPAIREMAQNYLIDDVQAWFDFIEARNKTSHPYNEGIAQEVYLVAIKFLPEGQRLLAKLKQS